MPHWSRHAETGSQHIGRLTHGLLALYEKRLDHLHQAGIIARVEFLFMDRHQLPTVKFAKRQVDLGAANISGKNHRWISSRPTPSAPTGGNAAAAAVSSSSVMRLLAGRINCDG